MAVIRFGIPLGKALKEQYQWEASPPRPRRASRDSAHGPPWRRRSPRGYRRAASVTAVHLAISSLTRAYNLSGLEGFVAERAEALNDSWFSKERLLRAAGTHQE